MERDNFETSSYPANAAINGRPDWRLPNGAPPGSSLEAMQSHLLDRLKPAHGICNVIHGAQVMLSEGPVRRLLPRHQQLDREGVARP